MNIFDLTGSIVYRFPRFIKDRLERAVFIHPQEKLPDRKTGTHVGIVVGGATGRIEKALELYKQKEIDYFLVTGGIGPYSVNQQLAEAEIYAETLIAAGVPDDHVWIENRSTNTLENVEYSMEFLLRAAKDFEYGFIYPIVITSGFHLKRTVALFEKAISKVRTASAYGVKIAHCSWSAAPFASCEPITWRNTEVGCALVAKEAFRLLSHRIAGKI